MTEPESPETLSEEPKAAGIGAVAPGPEQEPEQEAEPWTPERVSEWNAYYDLFVALGVLLLALAVSANKINQSSIWTALQAGRTAARQGWPAVRDVFSYTMNGQRWVNVPWLFEWTHALIYDGVFQAAPASATDPAASTATREQIAAGALVALTALARLLTMLTLLSIRRSGPGLWWSAVCTMLALGASVGPTGLSLGGIAGVAQVAPSVWGTLFLALELLIWFRAFDQGQRRLARGALPLVPVLGQPRRFVPDRPLDPDHGCQRPGTTAWPREREGR